MSATLGTMCDFDGEIQCEKKNWHTFQAFVWKPWFDLFRYCVKVHRAEIHSKTRYDWLMLYKHFIEEVYSQVA